MLLRLTLALLAALATALLALPAAAQDAEPPAQIVGEWDLRIDERTIFRFAITQDAERGEWRGTWSRPQAFNSDGNAFYNIGPGVRRTASMTGLAVGEEVELAFDDPRPGAVPDIFRFRLTGPDAVEMTYVGTGLAPYALVRAIAGEALGNWDAARVYRRLRPSAAPRGGSLAIPNLDFNLAQPPGQAQAQAQPGATAPQETAPERREPGPSAGEPDSTDDPEARMGYDFLEGA